MFTFRTALGMSMNAATTHATHSQLNWSKRGKELEMTSEHGLSERGRISLVSGLIPPVSSSQLVIRISHGLTAWKRSPATRHQVCSNIRLLPPFPPSSISKQHSSYFPHCFLNIIHAVLKFLCLISICVCEGDEILIVPACAWGTVRLACTLMISIVGLLWASPGLFDSTGFRQKN